MTVRSLNEGIYRLGQFSADRAITNASLLRRLAEIITDTLGIDLVLLAVFERGIESPATAKCVRGPWSDQQRDHYLEQIGIDFDEQATAQRLSGLRRGRLYHRHDLVAEFDSRTTIHYGEFPRPNTLSDQASALYRRSDGIEMLVCLGRIDSAGPIQRTTLARSGALMPYVAQCWASLWRAEPPWMTELKPHSLAILECLLEGLDDDQIAQRTGLSYHSVRAHLKRLFREAGVRSRLHLMQICKRQGPAPTLIVEIPAEDQAEQAIG